MGWKTFALYRNIFSYINFNYNIIDRVKNFILSNSEDIYSKKLTFRTKFLERVIRKIEKCLKLIKVEFLIY